MNKWRILHDKSKFDTWLELEGTDGSAVSELGGPEREVWNRHVICKWDGCVEYRQCNNAIAWDHECSDTCNCLEDWVHICSIDDFIEQLKAIKEQARTFYGPGHPEWDPSA